MICLDTNYLITGLVAGSAEGARIVSWSEAGETFCAASITWYEFLCGPVTSAQVATMRGILHSVVPFDDQQASEAARLFNGAGRRRRLRVDAMIAAAATSRRAALATNNHEDFAPFVPLGLRLVEPQLT